MLWPIMLCSKDSKDWLVRLLRKSMQLGLNRTDNQTLLNTTSAYWNFSVGREARPTKEGLVREAAEKEILERSNLKPERFSKFFKK